MNADTEIVSFREWKNPVYDYAKKLRVLLKKEFQGIKFSVKVDAPTSRHVSGLMIDWIEGPSQEQVEKFVKAQDFDCNMWTYRYSEEAYRVEQICKEMNKALKKGGIRRKRKTPR